MLSGVIFHWLNRFPDCWAVETKPLVQNYLSKFHSVELPTPPPLPLHIVRTYGSTRALLKENHNVIAYFGEIYSILQITNYKGNEKYFLVLVHCHDGIIVQLVSLYCVFHSSSTHAKPKRLILFAS